MRFYNNQKILDLNIDLREALLKFRDKRKFNAEKYISDKIDKLNKYMNEFNLKACIVGISGGVDSAITYGLICRAAKEKDSPIKKIIPVFLPVYNSGGTTNQETARIKAKELVEALSNASLAEIDLSKVHELLKDTVDKSLGIKGENWAAGQLVSYLRTPAFYYVTSLFTQEGYLPIFCGTTNRDEGAYLGYFGKASDGMADVQLISDIHKSEIYKVAKMLGIPESIINAVPTGDMYDNRSDVEVFGASYDFVELYLNYLNLSKDEKKEMILSFSELGRQQFEVLSRNIEDLHNYNKHKYLGASPAIHLDVIDSRVEGGWKYNIY